MMVDLFAVVGAGMVLRHAEDICIPSAALATLAERDNYTAHRMRQVERTIGDAIAARSLPRLARGLKMHGVLVEYAVGAFPFRPERII